MSHVAGLEGVEAALARLGLQVSAGVDAGVIDEVRACQAEAVDLCPVYTGAARTLLASSAALRVEGKPGARRVVFEAPGGAYYLKFVEFGTKAYVAGGTRRAGKDKKGKQRFRKVKRQRPAHRAFPFFRPAVANLFVRLRRARNIRTIISTVTGN